MLTPHHSGTLPAIAALVLLASCSPLRHAVLQAQRAQELVPDEPVRVVLTVNDAAVAQADAGVMFSAIATVPGEGRLELVADDPSLDGLVVQDARPDGAGGTSLSAWAHGGDLRALCAGMSTCEVGVTLVLVADAPAVVSLNFGVVRDGDRGWFGVRGPAGFDTAAAVSARIE